MNASENIVTFLVGCKLDVVETVGEEGRGLVRRKNAVSFDEGRKLAEEKGSVGFCEVSSKLGYCVKKPFVEVVDKVVSRPGFVGVGRRQGVSLGAGVGGAEGGCAC